ncbi:MULTISPECIES: hypothetical protein [Mycobacteroides]|jgi:hypothetical protein|uniref:Helix-turn-helix domain-containing protein n=1 Tax=Mycobacteroides chelonae TaxID=1774 RepID=A0AB73M1F1_MYCCH|nr:MULTISPECIES: hypothetical protein [Mycobacteroides]KRQ22069.1 hypothetical protein AOT86_20355 [Mycobacteroides sp. H072]KRQ30803.1 hypothetical protein AOT84_24055 [Mycobacteroides sp. H002]KRQ51503.1 hypothetical protein AOT85_11905 [Mycobacteroides sp. H054]KRQ69820.1 hypothetical protein AOT83_13520 [Mycobacteroides sp. H001]MBF9318952.1 hypothetical protein [Mycobacteroides chelonae]
MLTVHGLAGFQSGCRCAGCSTAESERLQRIGDSERERWELINQRATRRTQRYFADAGNHPLNWQKPWTTEEIDKALDASTTAAQVAAHLGRSIGAVHAARRRFGPRAS